MSDRSLRSIPPLPSQEVTFDSIQCLYVIYVITFTQDIRSIFVDHGVYFCQEFVRDSPNAYDQSFRVRRYDSIALA